MSHEKSLEDEITKEERENYGVAAVPFVKKNIIPEEKTKTIIYDNSIFVPSYCYYWEIQ